MSTRELLRRLAPILRRRRVPLAGIVVLGLLTAVSEGVGLSLFLPLFYSLQGVGADAIGGGALARGLARLSARIPADAQPLVFSFAILGALLVKNLLRYASSVLYSWLDARLVHDLRAGAMDRLLAADLGYVERHDTGRLVNTLNQETWDTSTAVMNLANQGVHGAAILVFVALLLSMSWHITLIVGAALVVISAVLYGLTRRVKALSAVAVRVQEGYVQRTFEVLRGMRTIRAFGLEGRERERFDAAAGAVRRTHHRMERYGYLVHPVSEVLIAVLLVGILLTTLHAHSSLPLVLTFLFVLYRLYPQLQHFDYARTQLFAMSAAVATVTDLLAAPVDAPAPEPRVAVPQAAGRITFEDVSYRYAEGEPDVLRAVGFAVEPGQMVALVGPSGSGKSTVLGLLLRFFEPTEGRICVDGVPMARLDRSEWRSRLAYVGQDAHLFNATIRDNIAAGRPGATDAEVEAAARKAHAHDFIAAMPQGYDTHAGDLGVRLSGGQRQRIALARALLRDPAVLVLDEATSALDSLSEQAIQETLLEERRRRTILVVAHRLSTIRQADHIVVLDRGRVVEQGTLAALLHDEALFARLYELQHLHAPAPPEPATPCAA